MNTRIIDTADAVVRRYKTRNPEEIISQRAIKLKDIRCCRDLLGYYTVMLNCEYIGINPNCTDLAAVILNQSLHAIQPSQPLLQFLFFFLSCSAGHCGLRCHRVVLCVVLID